LELAGGALLLIILLLSAEHRFAVLDDKPPMFEAVVDFGDNRWACSIG